MSPQKCFKTSQTSTKNPAKNIRLLSMHKKFNH